MKPLILLLALCALLTACDRSSQSGEAATSTGADSNGSTESGQQTTVAAASEMRVGSYVTLVGKITGHQSEDYYTFADNTGQMRVQIPSEAMQGQQIDQSQQVQLMGEIDSGPQGRYLWVKSMRAM